MASLKGFISAGYDRKTQPELLEELNDKLKAATDGKGNPIFGGCTTLDDPIANAGDPLVEIGMASTASMHELHEAFEALTQNLDPSQASGAWLDTLHACASGLTRKDCETDAAFSQRICNRQRPGYPRIADQVSSLPGVSAAAFVFGPYEEKLASSDEGMLVIKGEATAEEIGEAWYNYAPPGKSLVGEQFVDWVGPDGVCHRIAYQPGCRVFVDLLITGYADPCAGVSLKDAAANMIEAAKDAYGCRFGGSLSGFPLIGAGEPVDGVFIQSVQLRRRPRQLALIGADGETCEDDATVVTIDKEEVPWIGSNICGCCPAEIWCKGWSDCLTFKPWEFPDFDPAFCETVPVTIGC